MKEIKLVLKKKWYDMIESGEKPEEYRNLTGYWATRFRDIIPTNYPPEPEHNIVNEVRVTFYMGYAKNRPSMTWELVGLIVRHGNPKWGAEPGVNYYVLKLGKRIK